MKAARSKVITQASSGRVRKLATAATQAFLVACDFEAHHPFYHQSASSVIPGHPSFSTLSPVAFCQ